ncbi:PrpF domain-containing protein [Terribacillus saccharophilus]|uniref:PrpF domain-containing protein n=1 Tax=Terribacillus saccharophilus TaxID=361277 RepID=UPI003981FB06
MTQYNIPCALYRGGTSRGLFFHKGDLPEDTDAIHRIFLTGIDAYNPSQIDGVGSGTSHSSKVCVISVSSKETADVEFTFYQIGIGEEIVDSKGTCGNLMAAVGAFAVDEGYVDADMTASQVSVSVFNTNINKMLHITVPVENGKAKAGGDYLMPGLVKSGARFAVNILNPGGAKTGNTLPLELIYSVTTQHKTYEVSFLDVVNPFVFVSAKDLGIMGTELNSELMLNNDLLRELDEIRVKLAVAAGMSETEDEARLTPSIPKIAIVSEAQDYVTPAGKLIKAEEVDIIAKMISMGNFHRTFAGSGLNCLGAAALIPGTLPNRFARYKEPGKEQIIRIGQPEGVTEVRVALTADNKHVSYVGMDRTARRILKGNLYIPI